MDPIDRRPSAAEAAVLEARFGLRVAARLSQNAGALPHDISERLRSAREQALAKARPRLAVAAATAPASVAARTVARSGGAAALGGGGGSTESWWWRLSSIAPLVVLVAGLVLVQERHRTEEIVAVAEVDEALLTDALPPAAYADPGFAEFLKSPLDAPVH